MENKKKNKKNKSTIAFKCKYIFSAVVFLPWPFGGRKMTAGNMSANLSSGKCDIL